MRSQEQARSDAAYHATQLVDALQDADVPTDVIDDAESVQRRVSDE
jgi:hypothetical protein